MKNITKENKGITLITLITTIIIMSILISVATYSGIDTYKSSKIKKFVVEMQLIQTKVNEFVETNNIDEINNLGLNEISTNEQRNIINKAYENQEILSDNISEYKVLGSIELLNLFDIEDIQQDIMINFKTREVVSLKGIEYKGNTYYTQYKLPEGQNIVQNTTPVDRNLTFNINYVIEGINATAILNNINITNGTLMYKESKDINWSTITNYTKVGEEYKVIISKSGTYEFMLQDNITKENSNILEEVPAKYKKIIMLTNSPKTNQELTNSYDYSMNSENWAYVVYNENTYLWIPRFAYKIESETNEKQIKFVKGNSSIATDNTYIDNTWIIHEKFKKNEKEFTGVWVKIERQSELDMITLLNSNYEIMTEINL